uniref:Protein tyrosine phosphatase n=1 Tax=Panagrolaimus sp. JU765 TaxID=591449 RepID=A0AC34Q3I1_9BILA
MAVLQLCKFVEKDQEKCAIYYPRTAGEEAFFRDIRVKCTSVQNLSTQGKVIQRIFSIYRGNLGKDVYHLCVDDWPDHGVPEADTTLLHVLQKVRSCVNRPIVVHCSAGIGRTGTMVAIENVLETLMSGKEVSIYDVVIRMRQERAHSVQRESQYLLITRLVLEYLVQVNQYPKTKELEAFFEEYEKVTSQGGSQRI